MQKLPYVLLFVVLALVVINIATLRHLDRLEKRVHALDHPLNANPTDCSASSHAACSRPTE